MSKVSKNKQPEKLSDLIAKIDWKSFIMTNAARRLPDDAVSVGFAYTKLKKDREEGYNCDRCVIKIGKEVLNKLGWCAGDKIYIAHDPDNQFLFLLFKSDSGNGYHLGTEKNASHLKLQFSWKESYSPVKVNFSKIAEHEVYKKQLIIKANHV